MHSISIGHGAATSSRQSIGSTAVANTTSARAHCEAVFACSLGAARLHAATHKDLLAELQALLAVHHELVTLEVVRLVHLGPLALVLVVDVRRLCCGCLLHIRVARIRGDP